MKDKNMRRFTPFLIVGIILIVYLFIGLIFGDFKGSNCIWNQVVFPQNTDLTTWSPVKPPGIPDLATWSPVKPPGIPDLS